LLQYDAGIDSASNRKWCQEYLLGGKGGRGEVLLATFVCKPKRNSGSVKFLDPLGNVQVRAAFALLTYLLHGAESFLRS